MGANSFKKLGFTSRNKGRAIPGRSWLASDKPQGCGEKVLCSNSSRTACALKGLGDVKARISEGLVH
uniref:Uncharacterized protein n=1 Tax=Chenopodium quinoa TaxID=63459 RepID=A0A803LZ97_CHEQI